MAVIRGEYPIRRIEDGAPGAVFYTWIKYSDYADGTNLYDNPVPSTRFMGVAHNKPSATPSNIKTDYQWSLIKGDDGEDAITLHIESVNGNIFKNSSVSTVLVASIISGEDWIQNSADLRTKYGPESYLKWREKKMGETEFSDISKTDDRISDNGFIFTISPEDITTKSTFKCDLITEE